MRIIGTKTFDTGCTRREQVLWQMVSYLQGVVDATASHDVAVRVCAAMGEYHTQLDDLQGDMEVF